MVCALNKGSMIRRQMCWGNRNSQRPWTPRRILRFPWSTRQWNVSLSTSRRCHHCYKNLHVKNKGWFHCLNLFGDKFRTDMFKRKDFYSERISPGFSSFHLSNMNTLRLWHCLSDELPSRREKKTIQSFRWKSAFRRTVSPRVSWPPGAVQ